MIKHASLILVLLILIIGGTVFTRNANSESDSIANLEVSPRGHAQSGNPSSMAPFIPKPVTLGVGTIHALSYSPKGDSVAISSNTGLYLWKVYDNSIGPRIDLVDYPTSVNQFQYSKDGTLVAALVDQEIKIFDVSTQALRYSFLNQRSQVLSLSFLNQDRFIVAGREDGSFFIWDLETQQEILSVETGSGPVLSIAGSLDGNSVVTGSEDGKVLLWDINSRNSSILQNSVSEGQRVRSLRFSPDDSKVVALWITNLTVWNLKTHESLFSYSIPTTSRSYSGDARFSSSQQNLLVLTESHIRHHDKYGLDREVHGSVVILDANSGQVVKSFSAYDEEIVSADLSPDGRRIVTASQYGYANLWDYESTKKILDLTVHNHGNIVFTHDNHYLLTSTYSSSYRYSDQAHAVLWDLSQKNPVLSFDDQRGIIYSVALSSDSRFVATGDENGYTKTYDLQTGEHLLTLGPDNGRILSISFSPHNAWILTTGFDNHLVTLWDRQWGHRIRTFDHGYAVRTMLFTPDQKRIMTGGSNNEVKLWDIETGEPLKTFSVPGTNIVYLAITPDMKNFVSSTLIDDTFAINDMETGSTVKTYPGAGLLTPDGQYVLLYTSRGQKIEIKKFMSDVTVQSIDVGWPINYFLESSISPDGKKLVLLDTNRVMHVWDLSNLYEESQLPSPTPTPTLTPTVTPTLTPTPTVVPETSSAWIPLYYGSDWGQGIAGDLSDPREVGVSVSEQGKLYVYWLADYLYERNPHAFVYEWMGTSWNDISMSVENGISERQTSYHIEGMLFDTHDHLPILLHWNPHFPSHFHKWTGTVWQNIFPSKGRCITCVDDFQLRFLPDSTPLMLYAGADRLSAAVGVEMYKDNNWRAFSTLSDWNTGIADQDSSIGEVQLEVSPSGKIYALWEQEYDSQTAVYMKQWIHDAWRPVGMDGDNGFGFTGSPATLSGKSMILDSHELPIVVYESNQKIYVLRFDGMIWKEMGSGSASGDGLCDSGRTGNHPILLNTKDQNPLVIWRDQSGAIYAKQFNGVSWVPAGDGATSGNGIGRGVEYDAATDPEGNLYIAYLNEDRKNLYVKQYLSLSLIEPQNTSAPTPVPTPTPVPGWFVLDGFGGIHSTNQNLSRPNLPYIMNYDVIRDLEPDPLGKGWYMLDGHGGIHTSSPDLPKPSNLPYFGFDIARNLEVKVIDGEYHFYLLDGYGSIHSTDPAFHRGKLPWIGLDLARDLEPIPWNDGWWMLDAYGILHSSTSYRFEKPLQTAWKIPLLRSMVVFPDDTVLIMDAYAGRHTHPYFPVRDRVEGLPRGFYFPGWDIIWDVEVVPQIFLNK